jgi:hypothetical protein
MRRARRVRASGVEGIDAARAMPARLPQPADTPRRPVLAAEAGSVGHDGRVMTVFLVLLIPLLLMVFALLMERVENRLRNASVSEDEVEEFLDQARPEEVNTFIREGWGRALSVFRLRRKPKVRTRD